MVNISNGEVKTDFRLSLGPAESVTLASDIGAVTRSYVKLCAESATSDDCTQLTGLAIGDIVIVIADSGDTITMKDGTNMIIGGDTALVGNNGDTITLICSASGICTEIAAWADN